MSGDVVSQGGYISGPPIDVAIRYIRTVEPGLHVVSIDGARPEYLISREWMKRNPGRYPKGEPPTAPEQN